MRTLALALLMAVCISAQSQIQMRDSNRVLPTRIAMYHFFTTGIVDRPLIIRYKAPRTLMTLRLPKDHLKITFKSAFNAGGLMGMINDGIIGLSGFSNLIIYDVRVKVYLTRRFAVVTRTQYRTWLSPKNYYGESLYIRI